MAQVTNKASKPIKSTKKTPKVQKSSMVNLVIVESPTKAGTIKKYLGKGYEVVATMGHIRDLPKSRMGIDVKHNFEPEYVNIRGKGDTIKKLKAAAKSAKKVFLATDPDREGEAISWHLVELLGLDIDDTNRVTFNEITKTGVINGMENPRKIDLDLVDAQQARRVLDRLLGYELSPFLWKKVKRNLSAGRVQSVAVRMIVDREHEIKAFTPKEYWSIDGVATKNAGSKKTFPIKYSGKAQKKLELDTEAMANSILEDVRDKDFIVASIKTGSKKRTPQPAFTTSTLQQEASRRLGFQAKRTMKIAQELYEGINVDGIGAVGLITYMRTDSLRISEEALAKAKEVISEIYGEKYTLSTPRRFKAKKNAQDSHEAIRPSVIELSPERVKGSLNAEQYKLYKLIWERFIASQMPEAKLSTVSVDISAGEHIFKASGFTVVFDGYTVIYTDPDDERESALPQLDEGEKLKIKELSANQHFTQPPARYTEATLIKELEENGIGRPSTYAPTLTTILARGYVERENKSLKPTNLGEVTTMLMKDEFPTIVDMGFTAQLEDGLDKVEVGSEDWHSMIAVFYKDLMENLQQAEKNLEGRDYKIPDEKTDIICEMCGRNMVIKSGRFGKFLACPGFPECRNTKRLVKETAGCCPKCGKKVIEKRSKAGKVYFGCENNPECDFMTWDKPLSDVCPKCSATLFQATGRSKKIHCLKDGCGYELKGDKKNG